MSDYTLEDFLIAARTIFGEARGETFKGKRAVGHVLLNRHAESVKQRDHTLAATCLRAYQFSCWNTNDPNRELLINTSVDDEDFRECLCAILTAVDEVDFTRGSTHYHARGITPYWAEGHSPVFETEGHLFYATVR